MTKILYLITQSEYGGAQKNVLDLAREFKEKYQVMVAIGPDGDGSLFTRLDEIKIPVIKLKYLRRSATNPLMDLLGLCEIRRLLKKERPDVLHLHSSKAGVLGSLATCCLPKIKVIYTVHGAVFEASFSSLARKLFLWLEKLTARFKDKIICVSANDKKLWLKYKAAPDDKLAVIHNGLDLNEKPLSKDQAREELFSQSAPLFEAARGSGPDLKLVGAIANFYPEKGLSYFIEAANILINKQKIKNTIFIIIGEGLERPLLEEIIKDSGLEKNFILTGNIRHASQLLPALDIFVLPSVKEGLPYTAMEAMAAGLPIVASYVGGLPEIVEGKKNGFLVLPRNPDMLAKKIMELLQNPALAAKFSQAAKQKIQEFSLDKMVKETEKIYLN